MKHQPRVDGPQYPPIDEEILAQVLANEADAERLAPPLRLLLLGDDRPLAPQEPARRNADGLVELPDLSDAARLSRIAVVYYHLFDQKHSR